MSKRNRTLLHHASHTVLGRVGVSVLALLIVASFASTVWIESGPLRSQQLAAVVSARLVDLTNTDRSQNQLGTLTVSPVLTAAAQAKANDMAQNSYFAHTSPSGLTSWYWFKQAGYHFTYAGENLAVDFTDSDNVNQAWLNSPTHRANILNGNYTEIGIATAEGTFEGHPTVFVVQMFGTPQVATDAPETVVSTSPTTATEPATAQAVLGSSAKTVAVAQPAVPSHSQAAVHHTTPKAEQTAAVSKNEVATNQGNAAVQSAAPDQAQAPVAPAPVEHVSLWQRLLVSPHNALRTLYFLFGAILLVALLVRTRAEFAMHHLRHAGAVFALLVLMVGLFTYADHTVFVKPILADAASI